MFYLVVNGMTVGVWGEPTIEKDPGGDIAASDGRFGSRD